MDRQKRFIALLMLGVLLVLTPLVLKFAASGEPELEPSTAEYFPVQDEDTGLWGFIDAKGNPVTPMVFDWAGDFRHGRGLAESDGLMGYIDASFKETGEWVISPRFELRDPGDQPAHGFFDGLALARDADGRWGYLDPSGKWAIPPQFIESDDYPGVPAGDFSDGLAWFQVVEMDERHQLDANGKMVRDAENRPVMERYPRRLMGYINREGETVIEPSYQIAQDFGEGLAAVRTKTHETWGFIDPEGERVIGPKYERVGRFSEGLCAVSEGGLWGYIDPQGEWVIEPRFAEARQFLEGRAAAREGELWGYIDPAGQWVISPAFDDFEVYGHPGDPSPFENGVARATRNGETIYIDLTGDQIWPAN